MGNNSIVSCVQSLMKILRDTTLRKRTFYLCVEREFISVQNKFFVACGRDLSDNFSFFLERMTEIMMILRVATMADIKCVHFIYVCISLRLVFFLDEEKIVGLSEFSSLLL